MNPSIEPELQKPTPRPVRRVPGRRSNLGCIQLFILPHTLVGIGMLLWALLQTFVFVFGATAPGTIYHLEMKRGSKGSVTYHASYEYQWQRKALTGRSQISRTDYAAATDGQAVSVKVLPFLPESGEVLLIPGGSPIRQLLTQTSLALLWNAFLLLFYIVIYGSVWKEKNLVKNGVPVRGIISDKQIIRGKGTSYVAQYRFFADVASRPLSSGVTSNSGAIGPWASSAPLASGAPAANSRDNLGTGGATPSKSRWADSEITSKMTMPKDQYDALNVGDEVTILHHSSKPRFSTIYSAAAYRAA